jgi:hypothetical protein
MSIIKNIYNIIEYHDDINKLKNIFENNKKLNVNYYDAKKGFIQSSISCNNFEAYLFLIKHKNFNPLKILNFNWIKLIFDKYGFDPRYLNELCDCNIKLSSDCIKVCPSLKIFYKIEKFITITSKHQLVNIFSNQSNIDVQVYVLEKMLKNNENNWLTKNIIDEYILHNALLHNKISIIEILKKYNIDIKYYNGKPSIFILPNLDVYYDHNLFDVKYLNNCNYDVFNVNNFDIIKTHFIEAIDNKCYILNLFFSDLLDDYTYYGNENEKYLIKECNNYINLYKNKLNIKDNLFDMLRYVDDDTMKYHIYEIEEIINEMNVNKEKYDDIKTFFGCLLNADYQPTENYKPIINKIFGANYDLQQIKKEYNKN